MSYLKKQNLKNCIFNAISEKTKKKQILKGNFLFSGKLKKTRFWKQMY